MASDMSTNEVVEIEVELPRSRVEELMQALNRPGSPLKQSLPASAIGVTWQDTLDEPPFLNAANFDATERLASFRGLQARYASVTAQRHRAKVTNEILEAVPEALAADLCLDRDVETQRMAAAAAATSAPWPPPGGLPWYYRGIPGVIEPRVHAPRERERDLLEVDDVLDDAGEELGLVHEDTAFRKDGLDMGLQHLRTQSVRMLAQTREYGRRLAENSEWSNLKDFSAEPELGREWLRQQQVIREQQRIGDELKLEHRYEEEKQFWAMREKRQQQGDGFDGHGPPWHDEEEINDWGGSAGERLGPLATKAMEYLQPLPDGREGAASTASPRLGKEWPPSTQYRQGLTLDVEGSRIHASQDASPAGSRSPHFAAFAGFVDGGESSGAQSSSPRSSPASSQRLPGHAPATAPPKFAAFAGFAAGAPLRSRLSTFDFARAATPAVVSASMIATHDVAEEDVSDDSVEGRESLPIGVAGCERRFLSGACLDQTLQFDAPDIALATKPSWTELLESCAQLLAQRDEGLFGESEVAGVALGYAAAVVGNSGAIVEAGEAGRHAALLLDVCSFYPLCAILNLWCLEALLSLVQQSEKQLSEVFAGPLFEVATSIMLAAEENPVLYRDAPGLSECIAASLAQGVHTSLVPRFSVEHVDFALRHARSSKAGPVVVEQCLQVLMVARSPHRIRDQANVARTTLRTFRSETHLVPRALLTLASIFSVAVDGGGNLATTGAIASQRSEDAPGVEAVLELVFVRPVAGEAEGRKEFMPVGLREIVTVMDLYAQDRKMQGAGAVALAASARLVGVAHASLMREGAVRTIVFAQQHHPTSRSVALHMCEVVARLARASPGLLGVELVLQAVRAGSAYPEDVQVSEAALEVVHAFAPRLHELNDFEDRVLDGFAADFVKLAEAAHEDNYATGLAVVSLVAMASNGTGDDPGGSVGERWRCVLERAAAVALPVRALYEHLDDAELACAAAIALRCLSHNSEMSCRQIGVLQGTAAIFVALRRYGHRHDTVRELLAALANSASDSAVCDEAIRSMPNSAITIYTAMGHAAGQDPDALFQGCRALGALFAELDSAGADVAFNFPRISQIAEVAVQEVSQSSTHEHEAGLFGRFLESHQILQARHEKVNELCQEICARQIANGSVFGRLVGKNLKPTSECVPRVALQRG